jgi:copper chaperone CopZ
MKKVVSLIVLMSSLFFAVSAQEKKQEVTIHTSSQCGDCKERIENKFNYTKGIIFAELNLETDDLTVKFRTDKISLQEIKDILNELGYEADDQKAKLEQVMTLPECCQPNGME